MAVSILHCHSTFAAGGKELRSVRLMNAFGARARHTILSAVPGEFGARDLIDSGIDARFSDDAPPLAGPLRPARYATLAEYMRRFDLVLSYNWGAMDAVLARRMMPRGMPPLVHHEDGFNADEAARLKPERNLTRRFALGAAHAVVVPSARLERIAREVWKQPARHVRRIANGVDVARYGAKPSTAIAGLTRKRGEIVIGAIAGLRAVKNLPALVRAAAPIPNARLVIFGEGAERDRIAAEGERHMPGRLTLPGFVADPAAAIGHFDIFALSSDSEQAPVSLIEAMAAGLPVASTDVGDVAAMLPPEQRSFVGPDLAGALMRLAGDRDMREALGAANCARAAADYDEAVMIAIYAALYGEAIGWPDAFKP